MVYDAKTWTQKTNYSYRVKLISTKHNARLPSIKPLWEYKIVLIPYLIQQLMESIFNKVIIQVEISVEQRKAQNISSTNL